jgi:hypothetical protein
VKFSSVSHLSLHIPQNFGDETTSVYYIGLQGDWMDVKRQEIVITAYEKYANPADHKNILNDYQTSNIK